MSTRRSGAVAATEAGPGAAVAVIASVAQFMVVLDGTIVNVALPSMRRALGFSALTQQWIITSYLLAFGGLLLLGGRVADVFGRRRVFLAGLALFSLASLLGGLAPTGATLLAARIAQGVGGALLAPAPMALIAVTYPEGPRRVWAIGLWSATAAMAGTAGVVFGGLLTQVGDWRWVMFVNVPIGVALVLAGARHLPPDPAAHGSRRGTGHLDLPGAVLITGGIAALLFAITGVGAVGWSAPRTLASLATAVLLLAAFAVVETRVARPLLSARLLRLSGVRIGNLAMAGAGWLTSCIVLLLTLIVQEAYGLDPLHGGLALLPLTVVIALVSLRTRRVQARIGWRGTLAGGSLILASGLLWQAGFDPAGGYVTQILLPDVLIGVGLGMLVLPSTTIATTGIDAADAGLAAALINTSRQLGGSIGVAVFSTLATAVTNDTAAPHRFALTAGYSTALRYCAALAVLLAALSLVGIRPRRGPTLPRH